MYRSEDGTHYKISGKDIVKLQKLLENSIDHLGTNLVCNEPHNFITNAKAILSCYRSLKEAYKLSLEFVYLDGVVEEKMKWLEDIEGEEE